MSSANRRTLPARADLEQQKKQAKELLTTYKRGDRDAHARVRAELPDKQEISLADTQFVLAREYGFASWRALREHIETLTVAALPPLEQMKRSVRQKDAASLRQLLRRSREARAAVNEPIFDFNSPALVAVGDAPDVVDVLLEFGADPNRKTSWWAGGFHPLYGASDAVAERLLAAGAVPDACAAAHLGRIDLLARMLADDPSRVHERGGDGQMPLHFARSRAVVDLLLDAGADLDARDIDHRSTAAEWMVGSRSELAGYLVERGASADIFLAAALGLTERACEIVAANPLALALRTGQGDYGEQPPSSFHIYLWTIGANLTPLQTAARFERRATLGVLREMATPEQQLLLACHEGAADDARAIARAHPGIVERLRGADRRALTDEAWLANGPAVELMLELGFDPDVPSESGPTGGNALHCAAWEGSVECVSALLRYSSGRALLEAREPTYGGTPLSWCCHGSRNCGRPAADHAGVARLLVAAGANVQPDMECSDEMQAVLSGDDGRPLEVRG
jgi:ankyrin repeat protein